MTERLASFAEQARPEDNLYLNDRRADALREQLRDGTLPPSRRMALRLDLAYELLLAGETREAIAGMDALREDLLAVQALIPADARDGRGRPASEDLAERLADLRRVLGIASLRQGEQENCVAHLGIDACVFPIRENARHGQPRGSERALQEFLDALADDPKDYEARWLANLAAMTLGRHPEALPPEQRMPAGLFASEDDLPRFADVAARAGVATVGLAGGVVMEDLDGDGLLDLLVSGWGLEDAMHLYVATGDGRFVDRSHEAGLDGLTGGLNMVPADYDNDGDVDVLVLRGAWMEIRGGMPNSLLRNDGSGRFTDVTEAAGLLSFHPTQAAAWADIDNDGWLDLFIGNETGPYEQHVCELFLSDGDGTFTECAEQAGLAHVGYVKGVAFGDVDDDGLPDLYVSETSGTNTLYRNLGAADGPASGGVPRFRDLTERAGVGEPRFSFPTWFFDYDNDGRLDLLVFGFRYGSTAWVCKDYLGLNNRGETPRLYRNLGDFRFEDVTEAASLDHVLVTMGCNFGDLDNDGWPDFYAGTGEPDLGGTYPNRMFRNGGDGVFRDVTTVGGFGHLQKGHGVAFGDLDNDGDQDIYAVMGGAYTGDVFQNLLFENPGTPKHWISLRLAGTTSNRSAIGARIALRLARPDGSERSVHAHVGSGGSFGANSLQQELGLGDATAIVELVVRWPTSGTVQRFENVAMDRVYDLVEGEDELSEVTLPRLQLGGLPSLEAGR